MTSFSVRMNRRAALRAGSALAGGLALGAGAVSAAHADPPWHAKLSASQQVGQRVIFSYPGPNPSDELADLVRQGLVGGLIFFGENIPSLQHIADVVTDLRSAHAQSPTASSPLLLMTDQEGGFIRRLRGQDPQLSEKEIGLADDPVAAATQAGAGAGTALANVGMNLNLAPVLDVFREPDNFDDQWERSYSQDPAVCGELSRAFVTAQQAVKVAATAKHFPGCWARRPSSRTPTLDRSRSPSRPRRSARSTNLPSCRRSAPVSIW